MLISLWQGIRVIKHGTFKIYRVKLGLWIKRALNYIKRDQMELNI